MQLKPFLIANTNSIVFKLSSESETALHCAAPQSLDRGAEQKQLFIAYLPVGIVAVTQGILKRRSVHGWIHSLQEQPLDDSAPYT